MTDNPILDDETIRRKRAAIGLFLPLLNAADGDAGHCSVSEYDASTPTDF